jgi:hypothetical protein
MRNPCQRTPFCFESHQTGDLVIELGTVTPLVIILFFQVYCSFLFRRFTMADRHDSYSWFSTIPTETVCVGMLLNITECRCTILPHYIDFKCEQENKQIKTRIFPNHKGRVQWLRRSAAGLLPWRPGFNPMPVLVGFIVNKVFPKKFPRV